MTPENISKPDIAEKHRMYKGKIKLAICGAGKWGFNHIKTAYELIDRENIIVCDKEPNSRDKLKSFDPKLKFIKDYRDIIEDKSINAVIVATPAETHYKISKEFLSAGKNVMAEKPLTLHSSETEELIRIADKKKLKLMVGHLLLYHPAIQRLKNEVDAGRIGELQYIYSNRLNLGDVRSEENVLWSFAPHDVAIIQYLTGEYPEFIYANGSIYLQDGIEDVTLTYLKYPDNINAHIFVSWLHPFKEQKLVAVGSKGMFVFEDTAKVSKLKFYSKDFALNDDITQKFDNDYEPVEFEEKMPLTEEHNHFYESIVNNTKPLTDGNHALEVLKILEKAQEKI